MGGPVTTQPPFSDLTALSDAVLRAAAELAGATGAALIDWRGREPHLLRLSGTLAAVPRERPVPGRGSESGVPLVAAPVDAQIDLVVVRARGAAPFSQAQADALATVAALLQRTDARHPQEAVGALYGVAKSILASLDVDDVLLSVTNAASRLLRAEIAGFLLLDQEHQLLEMRCAVGHKSARTARLKARAGQGLAGKTLATGRPERIDDYSTSTSISKDFLSIAGEEETQSAMCVPLRLDEEIIGVLCVWRRRPSTFVLDDERLLVALAELATLAFDRARLYQAQIEAARQLHEAHRELERRFHMAQQTIRIHDQLTTIAIEADHVESVVMAVHHLTGGKAALLSDDRSVLATAPPQVWSTRDDAVWARLNEAAEDGERSHTLQVPGEESWVLASPVRSAGTRHGHLCVHLHEPPEMEQMLAVEQAATVCALLLARQEATLGATARLRSEFAWDLLEERVATEADARLRAHHLGQEFSLPARVVLVEVSSLQELAQTERWSVEEHERSRHWIAQRLAQRIEDVVGRRPVVAQRGDLFAAIVPGGRDDSPELVRDYGRAAVETSAFANLRWTAGISNVAETMRQLPEALQQGKVALKATGSDRSVSVFDDLGVLQFLLAPGDRTTLRRFADQVIGALVEYDRARGTELVPTLEAYLDQDASAQRTASSLSVHPKTVRYRLQRIEQLADLRLHREQDRFNARLALLIHGLNRRERGT